MTTLETFLPSRLYVEFGNQSFTLYRIHEMEDEFTFCYTVSRKLREKFDAVKSPYPTVRIKK